MTPPERKKGSPLSALLLGPKKEKAPCGASPAPGSQAAFAPKAGEFLTSLSTSLDRNAIPL